MHQVRPISLISQIYKLLANILINKLTNKLDEYQPVDQAVLIKDYRTSDHLLKMRLLLKKNSLNICLTFANFYKIFDSMEY